MAKILIPTPLRQYTDKKDTLELSGSTVGELLKNLTSEHPDLRKQLFNDEGKLRSFVNVYINDEDIRYLSKDATPVSENDTLTSENALEIMRPYDIIIDGTDNFPTRYLTNDACVLLGKPNVYGSIFRFEGQATVFAYEGGPCYRCLYPEPPPPGLVPSCAEGGVLGILPGTIGLIQATETVKLILGIGEPLVGRLLLYDALGMRFRELKL